MAQLAANPMTVVGGVDAPPFTVFKTLMKLRHIEWSGYTAAPAVFPKITDGNGNYIIQFNVDTATDVEAKRTANIGYVTGLIVTSNTGAAFTGTISIFFE